MTCCLAAGPGSSSTRPVASNGDLRARGAEALAHGRRAMRFNASSDDANWNWTTVFEPAPTVRSRGAEAEVGNRGSGEALHQHDARPRVPFEDRPDVRRRQTVTQLIDFRPGNGACEPERVRRRRRRLGAFGGVCRVVHHDVPHVLGREQSGGGGVGEVARQDSDRRLSLPPVPPLTSVYEGSALFGCSAKLVRPAGLRSRCRSAGGRPRRSHAGGSAANGRVAAPQSDDVGSADGQSSSTITSASAAPTERSAPPRVVDDEGREESRADRDDDGEA